MKNESSFFSTLIVSKVFRKGILDQETRLKTAQGGYLGEDFGIEEIDKEIFKEIGQVATTAEFAQKYLALKASKKHK